MEFELKTILSTEWNLLVVRQSLHLSQVAHQARAYPSFCSVKRLRVFLLPLDGMLVHSRVTPSIKFTGTHLYTWVERGIVRVKCLAQEHNTMSLARARTWTACSRVECTNHEATAPPTLVVRINSISHFYQYSFLLLVLIITFFGQF